MPTPAYRGTLHLGVPATSGQYAQDAYGAVGPSLVGYNPPGSKAIMSLTVDVVALPATAQIEIWLLDPTAFDPTNIAKLRAQPARSIRPWASHDALGQCRRHAAPGQVGRHGWRGDRHLLGLGLMGEIRIDVPDPLIDLQAIEQRVLRRRLAYTGLLGNNVISAPVVNHVVVAPATLSLGHPGLVLTSVVVNPTTATFVQAGQVQQFTAVALDQNQTPLAVQPPLGWASSVPAVASVSASGLVTCAGTNGVTTISAFVQGQPNFFGNAAVTTNLQAITVNHVTVTPATLNLLHTQTGPQIPTTVTLSPPALTLPLNQTGQLAGTVQTAAGATLSGLTLTWESTNQAVATVSSTGVVTPVSQGTTTIYASVIDQGQTLNTYANLKGLQHGYSVNYHYQGENPYQAQYSKVYADLTNGIATEEVAANAFHLTTSASTPGNIVWSQSDLATLDAQVAKVKAAGARMIIYWLNGDVANGEPSWFSTITTAALAQQALTGLCTFMALRYAGQVEYVLFNELMKTFGEQPNGYQTNTFITQMGQSFSATGPTPGFFAYAAAAIHAADPAAKIWINCNHSESDSTGDTANWTNILAMLTGLKGNGTPLTGFRFEMHQNLSAGAGVYTKFQSRCNAVTALGLKYGIGELDHPDDILLGSGPAGVWQRDEMGAAIRQTILAAAFTANAPPDHIMEWQDSSQTSWLNSPPEAGSGGTVPGGSVFDRQANTTDGDSFVVAGQTFYTHEVVPATGSLGQTASSNALSVMVTPAVGTALTSGAAVTYAAGLTGGTLAQTGGITLSQNVPSGAFVLPLRATTLTGTTIEGTHGRPNSRDENYVATPNYRAHLAAYGGPVGGGIVTVVAASTSHLPANYTVVCNTGPLTSAPSHTANGTWSTGGPVPVTLQMFSGALSSVGTAAANLQLTSASSPGSTGYRIFYPAGLIAGNAPVVFGSGMGLGGVVTHGDLYISCLLRFSPGFTTGGNNLVKWLFTQTSTTGSGGTTGNNHFATPGIGSGTTLTPGYYLQNPYQDFGSSSGNGGSLGGPTTSDGAWHKLEWLVQAPSAAGTANGSIQIWQDGVLVCQSLSNVNMFNTGESMIWNYMLFSGTYGGTVSNTPSASPPQPMSLDMDQLIIAGF